MARESRFRVRLPVAQFGLAALFGGFGQWQRSAILSRPFFDGQTLRNSTAVYHVWPWPYKFAVVSNIPAFLLGLVLSWPIGTAWPGASEYVTNLPSLLFVPILWYWVGSRLDRRWSVADKTPWIALFVFTLVSVVAASIPIGYVSYVPFGIVVWVGTVVAIHLLSDRATDEKKQSEKLSC